MGPLRHVEYLTALGCLLGAVTLAAGPASECRVTFVVANCSDEALANVEIAVEHDGETLRATTDENGRATLTVCADEVDEVHVYLLEDAPPISGTPEFEADPDSPDRATARIVVC